MSRAAQLQDAILEYVHALPAGEVSMKAAVESIHAAHPSEDRRMIGNMLFEAMMLNDVIASADWDGR